MPDCNRQSAHAPLWRPYLSGVFKGQADWETNPCLLASLFTFPQPPTNKIPTPVTSNLD